MEDEIRQVTPRSMSLEVNLLPASVRTSEMVDDMGQLIFACAKAYRLSMSSEDVEIILETRSNHLLGIRYRACVPREIKKRSFRLA
jgi:hypothetical protein